MTRLDEIRARLKELPEVGPYKEFPFFVLEYDQDYKETKKSQAMNAYMRFGFNAKSDLAALLTALDVAVGCLKEFAADEWPDVTPNTARSALTRITEVLDGK